ncbi:MAG TPA: exodeoxyribonuclease VII small subunit [Nitrospiria bacterium]|nr:exodeoxyribonuclease VII small subunit [Nitrospiria bacterium]
MEKKTEKMNFEEAMARLEEIVKNLEKGDLPLDKAMTSFEEGVKLSKVCLDQLEKADRKVEILLQGRDGQKKAEPFEISETS